MPGSTTEAVPDEEGADGDGDGESDKGGDGGDTEDCADGDGAGEDEEGEEDADDGVEPDGVDGRLGPCINLLNDPRERKDVVTCIGVSDARGSDHAALAHAEGADDCERQDGEGGALRHHLEKVGGPWLAEGGGEDGVDVEDGVGGYELEEPAEEAAEGGG